MIIGDSKKTFLEKKADEYTSDVASSKKSFAIGLAVTAASIGILALGLAFPAQVKELTSLVKYGSYTTFAAGMANLAMFVAPVIGIVKTISSKIELNDDNKDLTATLKELEKEKKIENRTQFGTSQKIDTEPNEVLYKSSLTKDFLTIGKKDKIIALSLLGVGAALIGVFNSPQAMSAVQSLGWVSTEAFMFSAFATPIMGVILAVGTPEEKSDLLIGKESLAKEKAEYIKSISDSDFKPITSDSDLKLATSDNNSDLKLATSDNNSDLTLATSDIVKKMQDLRSKTFSNKSLPSLKMS